MTRRDRTAETLGPGDYERLAAFRYMLRRFTHFSTAAAREAGLSTNQHQALLAIKGHRGGRLTVGGLADRLLVEPNTAAELVTRLEAAGLVDKVADDGDRRKVGLALTAKAETALDALTLVHLREVRGLAPRLMALLRDLERDIG